MSMSYIGRRLSWFAGLTLMTALLLVGMASSASAHSVLLATSPAASGRVATAPASVTLTFNEMIRGEYSNIHVVGPDNARHDSGRVRVLNDTVTEDLGGTRPAGTYVVDWRVISADGHPVSGQFSFTASAEGSTLAARQPDTTGTTAAKKSSGSSTGIVIVVVVVVVLVAGAAGFYVLRRRSQPRTRTRPGPVGGDGTDDTDEDDEG